MKWGRPPTCTCGKCQKCKHAAYMREWYRRKTPDERRAWTLLRDEDRVRRQDRERHHRKKGEPLYEQRRAAVFAVNSAITRGELMRLPCEVCGSELRVHGHHDDYSKPLEVRWLCSIHHAEEHGKAA